MCIVNVGANFRTVNHDVLLCFCYCSRHKLEAFTSIFIGKALAYGRYHNRLTIFNDVVNRGNSNYLAMGRLRRDCLWNATIVVWYVGCEIDLEVAAPILHAPILTSKCEFKFEYGGRRKGVTAEGGHAGDRKGERAMRLRSYFQSLKPIIVRCRTKFIF